MPASRTIVSLALAVGGALLLGRYSSLSGQQPVSAQAATVFEGARLIIGTAAAPIERSAFVVQGRRITAVGRAGDIQVPANAIHVDLTGKTVMPAIVDTHSHLGYFDEVADKEMVDNFTRARVLDHLDRFAYSGHAMTYSLGSDTPNFIDARYSDDPKTFVDPIFVQEMETSGFIKQVTKR